MKPWSGSSPHVGTSTPALYHGKKEQGKCIVVQCRASRCCEHACNADSATLLGFLRSPSRPEMGSKVSS